MCEVFTDKLVAKIPSTATGIISEIRFVDDDIIPVGHIMMKIDEMDEDGNATAAEEPNHSLNGDATAYSLSPVQPAAAAQNVVSTEKQVKDKHATAPPGN